MRTIGDGPLVERARAGNAVAATELFERNWPVAWRLALAMTGDHSAADDVAQVALVRAFRSLDRFDLTRPFTPWLKRIVSRCALDHLRTTRRWSLADEPTSDGETDESTAGDLPDRVEIAVLALEHDRRVVVVLRYWGDLGVAEIAALLGLPEGTVASRLSRALADLRKTIEEGSHARPGR